MTVDELVAELRKHPGDMRVYVRGYEKGVNDVRAVTEVKVRRNVNTRWYYGAHEVADDLDDPEELEKDHEPGLHIAGWHDHE